MRPRYSVDLDTFFYSDRDAASSERSESEENGLASERQISSQDVSDASSPAEATQGTHDLASSDPPSSPSPSRPRPSSFPSAFLSFREPAKNIKQLRQLALQGREETLREEAEGREKVVWGSVDGWRDAQVRRAEGEVLGGGTLPGAPASCEVDGVGVGVDDGVIGVSALGLTRGGDV